MSVALDGLARAGTRAVARLAWPLAVGMLSFTLMGVVDTLLMGHVSTAAQAGVGLATSLTYLCVAFFRGLSSGAQSLVSAADGAGDGERLRRAAGAGALIGAGSGFVAAGLLLLLADPLLSLAGVQAEVALEAQAYLAVRVWGLPCSLLAFGLLSALQGIGETRTRMWVSLAGNLLNGGLDLVLIFGLGPIPAMGAAGAATATVASTVLMASLYAWRFVVCFGWPRLPGREVLRAAWAIGLPAASQAQMNVFAFVLMNLVLGRLGAVQLAASQVVIQVTSVSFLPGFGVGEAGAVLVGRFLGAREPELAREALRSARGLALWLMGGCGLVFAFGGRWIALAFSRDPEVVELVGELLLFAAAFQLFDAVAMVHLSALRSAGDTRFTLWVTLAARWGILLPATLGFGLALGWGAWGAWLGLNLEVVFLAWVTSRRVRSLAEVARLDLLLGAPVAEPLAAPEREGSGRLAAA